MDLSRQSIFQRALAAMAQQGRSCLVCQRGASPGSEVESALQLPRIARRRERIDRDWQRDGQHRTLHLRWIGGQILAEAGKRRARLVSNSPTHVRPLRGFIVELAEQTTSPDLASRD